MRVSVAIESGRPRWCYALPERISLGPGHPLVRPPSRRVLATALRRAGGVGDLCRPFLAHSLLAQALV